jgi:hypothetical protein
MGKYSEVFVAFDVAKKKHAVAIAEGDFLAAAVAAEERTGGSALVASGDRDSFQLASPRTTILYPSRGGEIARIGPEEVRQRYGVDPKQVPYERSLSVTITSGAKPCFFKQFPQQFHPCSLAAPSLHKKVENLAFVVDRAPQPELPPRNRYGHLIEMPLRRCPRASAAKFSGE